MVLSKRERYILLAGIAVFALLALDQFMISPLLASKQELDGKIASETAELQKANRLFKDTRRNAKSWADMQAHGLRRRDASEAESQVLNHIRDWAQDAGMSLSSVKPERTEKVKDFHKITFRAAGGGRVDQISRFLYRIQKADIPVRVSDLTITSRKEGTDDLNVQIGISTTFLAAEDKQPSASAREDLR